MSNKWSVLFTDKDGYCNSYIANSREEAIYWAKAALARNHTLIYVGPVAELPKVLEGCAANLASSLMKIPAEE